MIASNFVYICSREHVHIFQIESFARCYVKAKKQKPAAPALQATATHGKSAHRSALRVTPAATVTKVRVLVY